MITVLHAAAALVARALRLRHPQNVPLRAVPPCGAERGLTLVKRDVRPEEPWADDILW